MSHLDIVVRETAPKAKLYSNHGVQRVGIPYNSGTGHEGSLGKTQMQRLLEQEEDLTPPVQRQAKVLLESITQQRTAGALSSCGLCHCGEN